MAKEATIRASFPRHKVQAWTRKKLNRKRLAEKRERKEAARAAARASQRAARTEGRALAVFEGVDPERTLALIGEEN